MQRGNLLKRGNRSTVLASLLLVALVLLVGCAPRATSGAVAAAGAADDSQIVIDLPALVLDVQPEGGISIGGQALTSLAGVGSSLAAVAVPADMVASITALNIQHIQIDNTAEGLLILVNGQPMPSLAWDGEKLLATADLLDEMGAGVALLDRVLPLITNLGIGVIIRFPLANGEEVLPMIAPESEAVAAAQAAQADFLAVAGTPVIHVGIAYNADGTWELADLTQADLIQMLPVNLDVLNLPAATISNMNAAGITELELSSNPEGIFISINGKTLPYITWADGRITHLLTLAEETGLLATALGDNPDMANVIDTVESLLPAVQATDFSLSVTFP